MEGEALERPRRARRSLRDTAVPWGYDVDRVSAAAVDPDRLYVSWEVTDRAIARACAALRREPGDVELVLRVHDTTGRLFDGTNAHHFFDQPLARSDRQWFFAIRRPSSSAVVELGLRGPDGRFAKIARSKRVDFPRSSPAPWRGPAWLTVHATGEVERAAAPRGPGDAPRAPRDERPAPPSFFSPIPLWVLHDTRGIESRTERWETVWRWEGGGAWLEPASTTSWTAGPFSHPVEVGPPSSESWRGATVTYRAFGVTHVVDGPWQVVIRNLGAHRERTVVSRWQMQRSWVVSGGRERRVGAWAPARAGASEHAFLGASEQAWLAGSELRLGGASERFRLGASELRFGGASERLYLGASQWSMRGASELRFGGASGWLMRGASERSLPGGSERRLGGSERRLAWMHPE